MVEPTFRMLEIVSALGVLATGTRITYSGDENIPERGGAVIAINHTSYVDFLPAALAVHRRHRRLRFMIKAEMEQVKVVNFLIKQRLRDGELVGVYPEATISRSFELKGFKTGASRMASEADVPIIPMIVWGAQRIWTKDHPRQIGRNNVPIAVRVGAPLRATEDISRTDAALRESMITQLQQVQERYLHPPGAYWAPRRLGGGAPTLAEAAQIEADEVAAKAAGHIPRQSRKAL